MSIVWNVRYRDPTSISTLKATEWWIGKAFSHSCLVLSCAFATLPSIIFQLLQRLKNVLFGSQERYKGLAQDLANLMVDEQFHLSAAVYTEVSDVEAEINGWVTYDRQVSH